MSRELAELTEFAIHTARLAGTEVIMPSYRMASVEFKADGTEVTEADRDGEALIRNRIEAHCPDAAILGEEFGGERSPLAGDQWIIDPIDGTRSFILGVPLFGTLIGLLRDGEAVLGVMHLPALDETLYASRGNGCWYGLGGNDPIQVRPDPIERLDQAFVSVSGVHATEVEPVPGRNVRLAPLVQQADRFRVVGDCIQHALVCRGRLHLAVDTIMSPWDIAALIPCVEEAGGCVAALDPDSDNITFSGSLVSAATRPLMQQAVCLLNG
ncbi:MAG: inositol monophosphatase family protein [Xanthomonadales bacterium]|nr:inositol monophosphatase family protein [Xanthomonadales bacterium]